MLSEKIVLIAMSAGVLTAVFSSAINSIFSTFVTKKQTESVGEIIINCLFSGCTGGLLVSVIFYYFASNDAAPIRMIVDYSIIIGIVGLILSNLLIFVYLKLFYRS